MARTSALMKKIAPDGAGALSVATHASAWTYGSWVEFIASTSTAIQVTELSVLEMGGSAGTAADIEVGIGAISSEIGVGSFRIHFQASASDDAPNVVLIPSPIDVIPSGSRVAIRARGSSAGTWKLALVYYEDLDSDNAHTGTLGALPAAGVVTVTGNATGWVNSSWVEISPALVDSIDIYGVAWNVASGPTLIDLEWEIGTGDSGSEVPVAVLRTSKLSNNTGGIHYAVLAAVLPVAAGERVAVRLRKGGTSTAVFSVSLLTYTPSDVPSPNPDEGVSLCGAEIVYTWMELQTDDGVEVYAKENLPLGDTFKEGRVSSFGTVRRGFSRERGGYETATASIELIDTDRVLRGLAATNTLINKRCDIYISTDEAMRAGDVPRRVMQGLVRRYKPLPQLKFRLDLEDFFGSSFSHFSGDREIPTRTFSTDDFPNLENAADDPVSPGNPTLAGKAVPIAYGHLSDAGSGSKGVVPCHYVGRRNVNSYDWDEYVVCGHAIKEIEEWYAAASVDAYDLPRELMPTSTEGVDFLIPGFAGWLAHVGTSDMFRDFNGNRYTVIYARGPRSDAAREGKVPFTLNIKAAETTGDGTGDLIESLPEQIEHLICNWILQSYESGDWPDIPTIGDPPYQQFRSTSTDVVKAATEARITGGYLGAFMLGWQGQFHKVSEIVGDACRSCDIDIGLNKDGQLFMSMVDVTAASVKDWSDVVDVLKDTFDIDHDVDRLANRIEYRYQRRYVDEPTQLVDLIVGSPAAESVRLPPENREPQTDWLIDAQAQEDTASILAIGEARIFDLSLTYLRDLDTATDVVAQLLDRLKTGPVHATFGVDLCGTDVENGDNCTIDEYQGLSLTGWTDRLIRIEEHELDLDNLMVTLVARDLG